MLVEKKKTKEIFAMKSLRKEELIDKDQIEHTKTEKMILESVLYNFKIIFDIKFAICTIKDQSSIPCGVRVCVPNSREGILRHGIYEVNSFLI